MRLPRIGVTCLTANYISKNGYDVTADAAYVEFSEVLTKCGAVSVLLPLSTPPALIKEYLKFIDGVVLSGGADIGKVTNERLEPLRGGEDPRKDTFEWHLCSIALHCHIPLLGICRGLQLINVTLGGSLHQDLPTELGRSVTHLHPANMPPAEHEITVAPNTITANIFKGTSGRVNSYHHQAIKRLAPSLRATAIAPDGVIEAIESAIYRRLLAVQFHPELSYEEQESSLRVFQWLVTQAVEFCELKDSRETVTCREERVG